MYYLQSENLFIYFKGILKVKRLRLNCSIIERLDCYPSNHFLVELMNFINPKNNRTKYQNISFFPRYKLQGILTDRQATPDFC